MSSGVLNLGRGATNTLGCCAECGEPSGRAWFCAACWHGQEWESARRCTAEDGRPCPACRESSRRHRRTLSRAAGARVYPTVEERAAAVAALRAGEKPGAVAARIGRHEQTVRRWGYAAGLSFRRKAPPRHGTPSGYGYHGCRCDDCTKKNRDRVRLYQTRRRGERLRLCCPVDGCGDRFASEHGVKCHVTRIHGGSR